MQQRRLQVIVLTALVAVLAVLGAGARPGPVATPGPLHIHLPRLHPRPQPSVSSRPTPTPSASTPPTDHVGGHAGAWIGRILVGLVLIAALAGAVYVLRRTLDALRERRRVESARSDAVGAPDADEQLVATAHESFAAALSRLRGGQQLDDAILECWRRLEDAAKASGVARKPSQTSTEFTVAVLQRTSANPTALTTLAELYRKAMFADVPTTASDRDRAVAALEQLAAELPASAPAKDPAVGAAPPAPLKDAR